MSLSGSEFIPATGSSPHSHILQIKKSSSAAEAEIEVENILPPLAQFQSALANCELSSEILIDLWSTYEELNPNGVHVLDIVQLLQTLLLANEPTVRLCIHGQFKKGIRIRNGSENEEGQRQLVQFFEILKKIYLDHDPCIESGLPIKVLFRIFESIGILTTLPPIKNLKKNENGQDAPISVDILFSALRTSYLPQVLVNGVLNEDFDALGLEGATILIENMEELCYYAVEAELIDSLCSILVPATLPYAIRIFYTILNCEAVESGELSLCPLIRQKSFKRLIFSFFDNLETHGSKSVRNDLGLLLYLFSKREKNGGSVFGPFANRIASIVSNNVLPSECVDNILDSNEEDVEFLETLIWNLGLILDSHPDAALIIESYELGRGLMRVLFGPCLILSRTEGEGLDSIHNAALEAILLIPQNHLKYFEPQIKKVLIITHSYLSTENKLSGKYLDLALEILRTVSKNELGIEQICENDGVITLLRILQEISSSEWNICEEKTLCNIILILSALTKASNYNEDVFYAESGVKIVLRLINRLIYAPANMRHMNAMLHICIADLVKNALATSTSALEMFLGFEGMFRMLELLELSVTPSSQLHILTAILELCEYPRCVDQLLYWRRRKRRERKRTAVPLNSYAIEKALRDESQMALSDSIGKRQIDSDSTLAALLAILWEEEEERLGVARDKNGLILQIDECLMSEKMRNGLDYSNECPIISCSVLDLLYSVRPKIYLLAKKMSAGSNTEALLFGGLSLRHQVTMELIVHMLDLKRGEMRLGMIENFIQAQTPLVRSDREALDRFGKISQNKVLSVLDTQIYLMKRDMEHKELQEKDLYNNLKETTFQSHLESRREGEKMAATSNYFFLVDKRLWQRAQLTRALSHLKTDSRLHLTSENSLNVTTWDGRHKFIESEALEYTEEDLDILLQRESKSLLGIPLKSAQSSAYYLNTLQESSINFRGEEKVGHFPTENKSVGDGASAHLVGDVIGNYEVNPASLDKALRSVLNEQKRWGWAKNDGSDYWLMRTKWKSTWYH